MPIRALPPDVVARIAAGEVVERPASVAKELIENALDAGATAVTVEVRGGGIDLLRVTDNGSGIPAAELPLAFQQHATSKLSSDADLDGIATLGFRGEALHSIAAVAWVSMVTRPAGQEAAAAVEYRWGQSVPSTPSGVPQGTTVTVRELFANVPARRRFLRGAQAEAGRVTDIVARMALSRPDVRFLYTNEGRESLQTPGDGDVVEAAAAVYGAVVGRALLPVEAEVEGYRVSGVVAPPSVSRANRNAMTVFLNGRWIQNRAFTVAIEQSFAGFLPQGRYPLAVLYLSVPTEDVDVNVHPTKREVRLRHEGRVFEAIQRAIRGAVLGDAPVPSMAVLSPVRAPGNSGPVGPTAPFAYPAGPATGRIAQPWRMQRSGGATAAPPPVEGLSPAGAPLAPTPAQALPVLRIVGQVELTYIVAEGPDGLYLIDQHAAHERVLYEEVMARRAEMRVAQQRLLEPTVVTLDPSQEAALVEVVDALNGSGFVLEPFGPRTWLVRAVPALGKPRGDPSAALGDVLDLLAREDVRGMRPEERVAATVACHAAVRAGMRMDMVEMTELVRLLERAAAPQTCPHGRPTLVHLSSSHLQREFGRK